MKRVIIESPYAGDIKRNEIYVKACIRDSLSRGEAPFASHLFYTQILDDAAPDERNLGMKAGWTWMEVADLVAVYKDLGVSPGMRSGIDRSMLLKIPIEFRYLHEADKDPQP